ncbi:MAG: hypothetical protein R3B06_17600 [Kofleriaceae bacterium]
MGDRQDIDALLIGALYGELDGADRARLDVHLRSHPGDRAALDALTSTRALLADVGTRDLLGAAEPPNAVSARLMQEAARRAPAPRSATGGVLGFLASLLRPVAAHPALSAAAAAMLVIGAGTMMMNRGTLVVQPPAAGPTATSPAVAPPPIAPAPVAPAQETLAVQLDDGELTGLDRKGGVAAEDGAAGPKRELQQRGTAAAESRAAVAKRANKPDAPATARTSLGYVPVDKKAIGDDFAMKDVDEREAAPLAVASDDIREQPANVVSGVGQVATAPAAGAGVADRSGAVAPAPRTNDAWARDEHARMVKLVAAGRCTEAGKIGADIARRAPEYYQSAVANDRAVRSCQAYVDQARRAKAPTKSKATTQAPADLESTQK